MARFTVMSMSNKGLKSKQHVTGVNQETQTGLENKQFITRLSLSLGGLRTYSYGLTSCWPERIDTK